MTPDQIEEMRRDMEAGTRPTRHEGYRVDDSGNVWSLKNWRGYGPRKLALHPNSHGYPSVKVVTATGTKKLLVHVAVCEAFHGPKPSPEMQVCHRNGDRSDNRASNLRWGTASDNAKDRVRHGNQKTSGNLEKGWARSREIGAKKKPPNRRYTLTPEGRAQRVALCMKMNAAKKDTTP